jgi:hypothetical protein
MKKLMILLAVAFLATLSVNAQKENGLVVTAGDAKSIMIGSGMNVVFVQADDAADARISKEAVQKLSVSFEDGALMLEPKSELAENVYVVVSRPVKVTIGENATLTTQGILRGNIDLFVNPGAKATVRTSGKLNAFAVGDVDLHVVRTPLTMNVTANVN